MVQNSKKDKSNGSFSSMGEIMQNLSSELEQGGKGPKKLIFSARLFSVCGMPIHRQVKIMIDPETNEKVEQEILIWEKQAGHYKFTIEASPKHGLPFGVYARYIQIWIDTEILKRRAEFEANPQNMLFELGETLNEFIRKIDASEQGYVRKQIAEQWIRLAKSAFQLDVVSGKTKSEPGYAFAPERLFQWEKGNEDALKSLVYINKNYIKEVLAHRVPLDFEIIKDLQGSALGLDFYRWLAYRAFTLKAPLYLTHEDLVGQFCSTQKDARQTVKELKKFLKRIKKKWAVKAEFTPGKNRYVKGQFVFRPGSPPVLPKLILNGKKKNG